MSDFTHFLVPNISSCCRWQAYACRSCTPLMHACSHVQQLQLHYSFSLADISYEISYLTYMWDINSCWDCLRRRLSAAMENASLTSDVWNDVTTSPSQSDDLTQYLANIRDLALKVIYIIIGTVGVLDNLFVLIIFILFIKITAKVLQNCTYTVNEWLMCGDFHQLI